MTSTSSQGNALSHQFPLSPPPSPPATRLRNKQKRKIDPFEQLAITPIPSPPSSPPNELADDESLLRKIILTPILFISFLLSLFLVNYRDRSRRHKEHSAPPSILTYLHPSNWLDHEPYQHPGNSSWSRRNSAGHVEPHDAIGPRKGQSGQQAKRESWHLNKKIRKVSKLEISDAFDMRGKVLVGMFIMMLFSCATMWMTTRWLFGSISASLQRGTAQTS